MRAKPRTQRATDEIARRSAREHEMGRTPRVQSRGGVYFVTGADLVKIGIVKPSWTAGLESRLVSLRGSSPVPLDLHRFVPCDWPLPVERSLHRRFSTSRRHGEWFSQCILTEVDQLTDEQLCSLETSWEPLRGVFLT